MTRLRLSGRNLVSASCGSYMWLSASNTGKESSRDGMAISLQKSGFSVCGNDVTTSAQRGIPGLAVRSEACRWCRSVDDGEIHGRRRGEFSVAVAVAVAVYVDLHDHRPPAGPQHPGHRECRALPDRPQVADEEVRGRHGGALLQMIQPELSPRHVDERGDQAALKCAGSVDHG